MTPDATALAPSARTTGPWPGPGCTGRHRHRLLCTGCGISIDVGCSREAAPFPLTGDGHGFAVDEAEVVHSGSCRDCRGRL